MPRPFCPRKISSHPPVNFFKPAGIPLHQLQVTVLALDEYEALRLTDGRGLEHLEAARLMGVSRQTFTRIIKVARKKVADFLIHGSALKIEGGPITGASFNNDKSCSQKNQEGPPR